MHAATKVNHQHVHDQQLCGQFSAVVNTTLQALLTVALHELLHTTCSAQPAYATTTAVPRPRQSTRLRASAQLQATITCLQRARSLLRPHVCVHACNHLHNDLLRDFQAGTQPDAHAVIRLICGLLPCQG
jgi:hypothetical protein